ncbi:Fpg/Nei family DNA glycosylase [Rhodococcus sp. RS1C4]|uniref:Fpg/Nei family DNA glycosylase n=1 Tax=Nocardiaceae TaxID=85025 RepID=UPI00036B2F87|nr:MULTISPECIES: DNA-formamidopyrimidine glycosylase family protein [Rhodococcus]OZC48590.1 Fpg/Nei family DNA glycosylase [Rhodococcus sp. RS1C4]OZC85426.1 Fpg/Nei family DNA glycosylase [Rhodococcus sp. 06-418-1B]OZD12764.1 Fpg/Nei family DNA glycosylase [Rhodococcus sp. 06-156-4C]OZD24387.1 Fpg/Nei family DNA glycosylase [Rhodococcus sp. 06-156-3C]OZD27497.1 Fpg/Nei family DNA glycosylase [Rhodococcus sp. 06-156-4a]
MPEGHTLHRLARLHQRKFAGAPVEVSSPQGRFTSGAALVDGLVLVRAEAWGKHLLHRYESDLIVHIHLGLYGKFTDQTLPMKEPVGAVRLRMVGEAFGTDLRGPTACEIYTEQQVDALLSRLGPDPIRKDADPDRAWDRISRSRTPIGTLLMDQKVLAGVGNVYRAEILYRHEINPMRPGKDVDRSEWDAIWLDLVDLMKIGVRRGRIITIRPEDDHGDSGYAPKRPRTYVYRRAGRPCRICGAEILHSVMQARNLFWCPVCQAS